MNLEERFVPVGAGHVRVLAAGDPVAPAIMFLHGWPESAESWVRILPLAAHRFHAMAPDLPGIGGSTAVATDGTKEALARVVHQLVEALGLRDVVLVGHDIGGMVTYAYLRQFRDLQAAVIMDVVIPGVDPWERVLCNPRIWHFGWHTVPELPERLVQGNQRAYFDYFYDTLTMTASAIGDLARETYTAAYATDTALRAGFDWYRAFPTDAEANAAPGPAIDTPLLYLRGEGSIGRTIASGIETYIAGLRRAGVRRVSSALVAGALHFLAEEAPEPTWQSIERFLDNPPDTL